MKPEIEKHLLAYFALLVGLGIFVLAFLYFWPLMTILRILIITLGVYYVTWGAVAHLKSDRVTKKILLEYTGMALIACSILMMLTF